jgi:hypothetical protein
MPDCWHPAGPAHFFFITIEVLTNNEDNVHYFYTITGKTLQLHFHPQKKKKIIIIPLTFAFCFSLKKGHLANFSKTVFKNTHPIYE